MFTDRRNLITLLTLILQAGTDSTSTDAPFRTTFWWMTGAGVVIALTARMLPGRPVPHPTPAPDAAAVSEPR